MMAVEASFNVATMVADFGDGFDGAIGTCEGVEEMGHSLVPRMMAMEACFIIAAAVADFWAG